MGEIRLRGVLAEDLPVFFEHQRDPEANLLADFPPRDRDAFEAHWARILSDEAVTLRTVVVDGCVAGNVASFPRAGLREVGYWLGREYWGRGIATQALAAFLREHDLRPLHARVARHNVASRRVLEKCGFVASGAEVTSADDPDDLVFLLA